MVVIFFKPHFRTFISALECFLMVLRVPSCVSTRTNCKVELGYLINHCRGSVWSTGSAEPLHSEQYLLVFKIVRSQVLCQVLLAPNFQNRNHPDSYFYESRFVQLTILIRLNDGAHNWISTFDKINMVRTIFVSLFLCIWDERLKSIAPEDNVNMLSPGKRIAVKIMGISPRVIYCRPKKLFLFLDKSPTDQRLDLTVHSVCSTSFVECM